MEPYKYLEKVAKSLDTIEDSEEIKAVLDELEFLYEALDPEFQDLAVDLIDKVKLRLRLFSQ